MLKIIEALLTKDAAVHESFVYMKAIPVKTVNIEYLVHIEA